MDTDALTTAVKGDVLRPGQEVPQFALLEGLGLPDDVEEKIYRANAARLLDLD